MGGGGVRYVWGSGWEGRGVELDVCRGVGGRGSWICVGEWETDDPWVCSSYLQLSIVVAKMIMWVSGLPGM